MAYNPNPQLVSAIIRHARPGDRAIALATSLVESGGQLDASAVGPEDSEGPYQENINGRGAGLSVQQRRDPFASTQRFLKELGVFRSRGLTGGELAYATQRPADRAGYIQKINAALPVAKQILASQGGLAQTSAPAARGSAPAAEGFTPQGQVVLTPRTQKAVRNYIVRSERDALAGRAPGDISGLIGMIEQDKARSAPAAAPAQVARQSTPSQYRATPGSFKGYSMGGGPEAHGSRALGNWQSDNAYDLMGKAGDPVPAFVSGVVTKVSGAPGGDPGFAGYGITVRTSNGVELFYKHLGTNNVRVGQRITPQTILGTLDPTTAGGPHLHLGGTHRGFLDQLARRYVR